MSEIVNKLWGFCHTLRHDGMDYGDYIEQLTYLLFLKMAEEKGTKLPENCDWETLKKKSGTDLMDHYAEVLRLLREEKGLLGDIFTQSIAKFNNPVNLKQVIGMIDGEEWSMMDVDVKGAAFEGLLEKAASEGKKGAGQYFTPRPLIQSIIRVMQPDPRGKTEYKISDPACGTGGFLMCAYEWLMEQGAIDRRDYTRIMRETYFGQELVARPRRLALMNLFLHGLETKIHFGDSIYEVDRGDRYDCILTNPPFGTKGAKETPSRDDFTVSTTSKQLNFVQHVMTILKEGGRAAMVLPDNCLFGSDAAKVFKILMEECNLHTILRLPRGTFTPYSQGVKANVIFFQKGFATENVWIYDARTNIPIVTKKERPLTPQHFEEFERCYGEDPNGQSEREDLGQEGRFKKFHISEIKEGSFNLDITWLKDESLDNIDGLIEPEELLSEIIMELDNINIGFKEVLELLEVGEE